MRNRKPNPKFLKPEAANVPASDIKKIGHLIMHAKCMAEVAYQAKLRAQELAKHQADMNYLNRPRFMVDEPEYD